MRSFKPTIKDHGIEELCLSVMNKLVTVILLACVFKIFVLHFSKVDIRNFKTVKRQSVAPVLLHSATCILVEIEQSGESNPGKTTQYGGVHVNIEKRID